MLEITFHAWLRRVWLVCLFACSPSCSDDAAGGAPVYHPAVKMLVFSDPHYFDPSLGASGAALES